MPLLCLGHLIWACRVEQDFGWFNNETGISMGTEDFYCAKPGTCFRKLESKNSWATIACHTSYLRSIRYFRVIFSHFCAIFSHFCYAFSAVCGQAIIQQTPNCPVKIRRVADFFRVVRCLVNFNLVTKRTKHVSKVREVIRRCKKNVRTWHPYVIYDVIHANSDVMMFGFQFLSKITDFMTRLVRWPVDKNSPCDDFLSGVWDFVGFAMVADT